MFRLTKRLPFAAAIPLACLFNAVFVGSASAHVKWFCAYNVAGQPEGLENVLCPDFEFLTGLSILALMTGRVLEGTPIGFAMLHAFDRVTRFVRDNIETIFRAGLCLLLHRDLGCRRHPAHAGTQNRFDTGCARFNSASPPGCCRAARCRCRRSGFSSLFGIGVWKYGAFHLADYPIFLGVAAYLALVGGQTNFFGARPIDVLRWTAGITLMWASIEKWAYPEWSYPLFILHPEMTFGFTPDFFMRAAGAVEFALAFALMWTPLVRRVGAVMLAAMFVSAVFEFGKIDLIGHSLIVVALLGIIADDGGQPARLRNSWLLPFGYAAALARIPGDLLLRPRGAVRYLDALIAARRLLNVNHELHLRMNGAQHVEVAGHRERDVGLAARLLVAGVEREFVGIDIGVMQQVAVVVDDLDRLAALDRDFAGMKFAALLRDRILRQRQPDQRAERRSRRPAQRHGDRTADAQEASAEIS